MKKFFVIIFFCNCFLGINAQNNPKIAIFDPTIVSLSLDRGTSDAIRELISSTIVNSKKYNVLERALIDKILQEQSFSRSGMVNDKDISEIGKFAGADKVLVSILSSSSGKILFTLKLLSVKTSDVEYQQFCHVNHLGDLLDQVEPTVLKLLDMEIGTYEGARRNGRPHGYGTMQYKNGDVYRGQWVDGLRQGKGILEWSGGGRYDGEWFNDKEDGNGFMRNGGAEYNGVWRGGQKSGKGILKYSNGNRFEGEFVNNKPASGVLIFPNGDKYQGEFFDVSGYIGCSHGHNGIMIYTNGNKFKGTFYETHIEGTMMYLNGDRYEGRLNKQGKRYTKWSGEGVMYYHNGDVYKGVWENDKRDGYGVMIWNDGSRYEGNWKSDMMHGRGTMYSPKGFVKYDGSWAYGKKER